MSWFLGIKGRKEHVSHVIASGIQGDKGIQDHFWDLTVEYFLRSWTMLCDIGSFCN